MPKTNPTATISANGIQGRDCAGGSVGGTTRGSGGAIGWMRSWTWTMTLLRPMKAIALHERAPRTPERPGTLAYREMIISLGLPCIRPTRATAHRAMPSGFRSLRLNTDVTFQGVLGPCGPRLVDATALPATG